MSTETEEFWAGAFGNDYTLRNQVEWEKRIPFFRKVFQLTAMKSVLEVGCNAGWNLRAIATAAPKGTGFDAHFPDVALHGCDVNQTALDACHDALAYKALHHLTKCSALDLISATELFSGFDVVLTAGLLIHIPPEDLHRVMTDIVILARGYVVAIEYAWPEEQEVDYRGHAGRLWKRPYGLLYAALGLRTIYTQALGPEQGFGEGCTAWVMEK